MTNPRSKNIDGFEVSMCYITAVGCPNHPIPGL
jgi:hypothetical protein